MGEALDLAAQHLVHAVDEAAHHRVEEAHLLPRGDGDKILEALVQRLHGLLHRARNVLGQLAVQVVCHLANQRRLLLLVDGHLGHRIHGEHARVAAHGAVEGAQRVLGGALHRAGDEREEHRAHHAEDGGHEGVAHAGDQRDDGVHHGGGIAHAEAGEALGQADQRAQEADGHQQARHRLAEGGAAGAVDHGLLIDEVLHVGRVVVHAVGKEQVVQVFAPVGAEHALAQKVVLLPGLLRLRSGADVADGAADGSPRAQHRKHALDQAHYEDKQDDCIDQQIEKAAAQDAL